MFKQTTNDNTYKPEINIDFVEQIQAVGGIHFRDERYVTTGTGYETCIHVFTYANNISEFWLTYITGISNVIVTMDVSTESISKVQENINKNIKEQTQRAMEARDSVSHRKAAYERDKNEMLLEQLIKMDDVVKLIVIRIYVADKTREKVDEAATNVINHLSSHGYKSAVFLNENAHEWKSMYYSYIDQCKQSSLYNRIGQPVLASTLAHGNPFHYASLSDDFGSYWGDTDVGGSVLYDPFLKNDDRKSYNSILIGNMGSGKSTTLKKLIKDQASRGNFIRGFDVNGEFTDLITSLGGKVINLDGKDGIVNLLQILQSGENERINWQNHVSKLSITYEYLVPNVNEYELAYFQLLIKDFYKSIKLYPSDENALLAETGVLTNLPMEKYPILSDFRNFLLQMKEKGLIENQYLSRHNNVILIINNLVENFGNIFDGHTSIKDILSEQILYFNITSVLKIDSRILDTILYNILSLCWDNLIKVGSKMKSLYDKRQIAFEDITRFLIIIDEAHKIANANKLTTVQQLLVFMREARKYFGGLAFASQSIRDFVPESSTSDSVDMIKSMFELSQYKFIMQQDSNVVPMLAKIFDGQLTNHMINQIPRLSKGETILILSSKHSIKFRIKITEKEKILFAGGA